MSQAPFLYNNSCHFRAHSVIPSVSHPLTTLHALVLNKKLLWIKSYIFAKNPGVEKNL